MIKISQKGWNLGKSTSNRNLIRNALEYKSNSIAVHVLQEVAFLMIFEIWKSLVLPFVHFICMGAWSLEEQIFAINQLTIHTTYTSSMDFLFNSRLNRSTHIFLPSAILHNKNPSISLRLFWNNSFSISPILWLSYSLIQINWKSSKNHWNFFDEILYSWIPWIQIFSRIVFSILMIKSIVSYNFLLQTGVFLRSNWKLDQQCNLMNRSSTLAHWSLELGNTFQGYIWISTLHLLFFFDDNCDEGIASHQGG